MNQAMAVRSGPMYQGGVPVRDPLYLAFIRKQGSIVSGLGPCEACHTGPHAISQKASDRDTIPLTRREHERFDAYPRGFAAHHGLDIPNLIQQFNALYDESKGGE